MAKDKDSGSCGCFRAFDFYKDLPKGLAQPSIVGATVSTFFMGLMGVLLFYQVMEFISFQKTSEMIINEAEEDQFFNLNINITMPFVPCAILSLDIVDVTGVHMVNLDGRLHKHTLDFQGKKSKSQDAIAAKGKDKSQETMFKQTMEGLEAKEGCEIEGEVMIHKVPGNFHLSSHDQQQAFMMLNAQGVRLDFTHTLNELSFGDKKEMYMVESRFKETIPNELSGKHINQKEHIRGGMLHVAYHLDITEVEFEDQTVAKVQMPPDEDDDQQTVPAYEYPKYSGYKYRSIQTINMTSGMPALWFIYEITPVKVHYNVFYQKWGEFLVHLCAIVGGIFAAVGLFEALLVNGLCLAMPDTKKVEKH